MIHLAVAPHSACRSSIVDRTEKWHATIGREEKARGAARSDNHLNLSIWYHQDDTVTLDAPVSSLDLLKVGVKHQSVHVDIDGKKHEHVCYITTLSFQEPKP